MNLFRIPMIFLLAVILSLSQTEANSIEYASTSSNPYLTKVILQLNRKYPFEFAGYIAAKEKGYYHDYGLDVEIKSSEAGVFSSVEELQDKIVAMPTGYNDLALLRSRFPSIHIKEYASPLACLKAVNFKEADATVLDSALSNYLIAEHALTNVILTAISDLEMDNPSKDKFFMATTKDKPQLASIINKALIAIGPAKMMSLKQKWLINGVRHEMPKQIEYTQQEQEFMHSRPSVSIAMLKDYVPNDAAPIILSPKETAWLKNHPTIKVGNEQDYPPFAFVVAGHTMGYSIDLITLLLKNLGFSVEFVSSQNRQNLIDLFSQGKVDVLTSIDNAQTSNASFVFSKLYLHDNPSLVIHKAEKTIHSLNDIKHRQVALPTGSAMLVKLKKRHIPFTYYPVDNISQALKAISSGQADVTIENSKVLQYLIDKHGFSNLTLINLSDQNNFYFAVRKDGLMLRDMINKALDSLSVNQRRELHAKWFGPDHARMMGARIDFTPAESAYITQKKVIKMCVDPDWMPYEHINDKGEHEGLAADFIQLVQKRIGLPIELVKTHTWHDSLGFAKERKCDILSFLNDSPERNVYLNFTAPLFEEQEAIITRNDVTYLNGLESLIGKRIGLVRGYRSEAYIRSNYPGIEIVQVTSPTDGLNKVAEGQLFATIGSLTASVYDISRKGFANLKIVGETELHNAYRIGVRNDDPLLLNIFQKAVDTLTETEKASIFNKWISVKFEQSFDYSLLWNILAGIGLVFILVSLWMSRMAMMNRKIRLANDKAEAATKAKSQFLANMSHEIRTPMNAIIGLTALAIKNESSHKQLDYLQKIESSAHSLLGIINDILDFSKIEAGKLDMESINFNIEEIMNHIANLITIKAEQKGLELLFDIKADVPCDLIGDPLRLSQVLINLSNNAVKFTNRGQIIIKVEKMNPLDADPSNRDPDKVTLTFSVQDSGIGMTQEQIEKSFQSFSQADRATTRKFGGTGLGLTISKRLVELMNGKIWLKSEPGKGTQFSFTAQFHKQALKESTYTYPQDTKSLRVLVVDDNPVAREILSDTIQSFRFEADEVASGPEAIAEIENAYLSKTPYNLVLMDWKMPGMDGIEASRQIKQHPSLPTIPAILMVSAYGRDEIKKQAKDAGIEHFLTKPINRSLLYDAMMSALGYEERKNYCPLGKDSSEIQGLNPIRGAHILLVEDNLINQQIAQEILENEGFEIIIADNGKMALSCLDTNHRFDAILMDIQMPEMDGYETSRCIRTDQRFQKLPIIAMTAHAMAEEREKCLEAGMNDHVSKPIDPTSLFSTLVKWVSPLKKPLWVNELEPEQRENPASQWPSNLPGLDLAAGLKIIGGNKKLFQKILNDFAIAYVDFTDKVNTAYQNGKMSEVKQMVHAMKGVAGNIKANDLYQITKEIDEHLADNQFEGLEPQFTQFGEAIQTVLDSIGHLKQTGIIKMPHLPEVDRDHGTTADSQAILATIAKVEDMLSQSFPEAEDLFDTIKPDLINLGFEDQVRKISACIEDFEFKDARNIITSIKDHF